jgi:predicted cupin superfamily sugar epimerase
MRFTYNNKLLDENQWEMLTNSYFVMRDGSISQLKEEIWHYRDGESFNITWYIPEDGEIICMNSTGAEMISLEHFCSLRVRFGGKR